MRTVLPVVYAVLLALFAWWLDRTTIGVAREAYFGFFPVVANALPGLVLAGLLTALTRRPAFSFLLVALLQLLVYRASALKLENLGEPLGLQDLYFVTRLDAASFDLLAQYVERPLLLAAAAIALLAAAAALWWLEKPSFRPLRATQLLLAIGSSAMIATLATSSFPWNRMYRAETLRPSRFQAMAGILHAGLMSNLVYAHNKDARASRGADLAALDRLLASTRVTPPAAVAGAHPDVVVVLSESLFDAGALNGMAALPDPIPNVRAAIAAGHGGAMQVPTFGGGTIRTEFEILTGMPMRAFPDAKFPYVSLVRERIPSLVSQLEGHGYRTVAIHGNAGSFWNRRAAYRALGFDRFITESEFPPTAPRNGRWIADEAMTDLILRELDATGDPKLVVALSIEAHGPYKDEATSDRQARDAVQVPAALDAGQALQLRNYLYHARHADAQFGRLLEAIRARRRPTVLLFFGDHLPGLRGVFGQLGFRDGQPATRQPVPWVLLRSDQPGARVQAGPTESWMLPGRLLALAGLGDDPYFALTVAASQRLAHAPPAKQAAIRQGLDAAAVMRLDGGFNAHWARHAGTARGAR